MFPREDGGPGSPESLRHVLARVAKRVGLEDLGAHDFRHAFASNLANVVRATPREVQVLLGHSALATTQLYFHGAPDGLADRVSALADLAGGRPGVVGGAGR